MISSVTALSYRREPSVTNRPDIMLKAFEIAGYPNDEVERRFGGMLNAFRFGAPPHGGAAPGVDRIVMLLADEPNIREVILFPMNQAGSGISCMQAPADITPERLREHAHQSWICRNRKRDEVLPHPPDDCNESTNESITILS